MKYMLIEVMEREISEPEYFDTHDAAHDEMCRRVAEVYDISPDEVKESYLEGEDLNENAVVLEDIAWAERYCNQYLDTDRRASDGRYGCYCARRVRSKV